MWRSGPKRPPRAASARARCPACQRMWKATPSFTPASRQVSTRARPSARSVTIGFSMKTCLPARAAASPCSAWTLSGEAMTTASSSGSASSASRSSWAGAGDAAPWRAAKSPARARSRESTLQSRAPFASATAGASWLTAIRPVAIMAKLTVITAPGCGAWNPGPPLPAAPERPGRRPCRRRRRCGGAVPAATAGPVHSKRAVRGGRADRPAEPNRVRGEGG